MILPSSCRVVVGHLIFKIRCDEIINNVIKDRVILMNKNKYKFEKNLIDILD